MRLLPYYLNAVLWFANAVMWFPLNRWMSLFSFVAAVVAVVIAYNTDTYEPR